MGSVVDDSEEGRSISPDNRRIGREVKSVPPKGNKKYLGLGKPVVLSGVGIW